MTIKLTETRLPNGGCQIYRPDFREMPIDKIEDLLQDDLQSYLNVGYNSFTFHRSTGTVSIRRIEIKTMSDIYETDPFGLLNK